MDGGGSSGAFDEGVAEKSGLLYTVCARLAIGGWQWLVPSVQWLARTWWVEPVIRETESVNHQASGRSGSVAAAVASAEEAFDDPFDAGRALGEGLDVFSQLRKVGADFRSEVLDVGANFRSERVHIGANLGLEGFHVGMNLCSERLHVGASLRTQALAVGAEFVAQSLIVGARLTPEGEHEADYRRADGEDSDEFGGYGRLPSVGLCR